METSAISYRVADFLRRHPPFHAMEEEDLVALAAHGRVRFFEANEFILWQGEPHKIHLFVIQQGTVSLWDERGGHSELRDVRGAGDLLGAEQFHGERACLYSARSASDVVVYGFPAADFDVLLHKYPYARQYVAALGTVAAGFRPTDEPSDPQRRYVHEVAGPLHACDAADSVAAVSRLLGRTGANVVAVIDGPSGLLGLVTTRALLAWIGEGRSVDGPISELCNGTTLTIGPDASIADAAIAVGAAETAAVAMTADGTPAGRLLTVVTPRELAPAFGDQPAAILHEIRTATEMPSLIALNRRARSCALQHLTAAANAEWVARFIDLADISILTRLIAMTHTEAVGDCCWCVFGTSGRAELMTQQQPQLVLIHDDSVADSVYAEHYARVVDSLAQCDYLPGPEAPYERLFHTASAAEWSRRYCVWIQNPVMQGMARSRALFDLRPFHGARRLWDEVCQSAAHAVDRAIVQVLAHDCLANLPPLTFYRDAVVEQTGEQSAVFRLEQSALRPLVDVGRVFAMAAREVMGTSTSDRFATARRLLPAHEAVFRDAQEALRIMLWQQGRVGISQRTNGSELPAALLSRHDRHLLRSCFPAILRMLELTADSAWLDAI